jgi:hypothetical protein
MSSIFISQLSRLPVARSGVALVEFALALPFLVVMLLGGLEIVHLALTHQQLSRIATSTADLAARYRSSIDETDILTLFLGSQLSASLDDFDTNGRIVLSSITRNPDDTGHWIRWQRCEGSLDVDSAIGVEGAGKWDTSIDATKVGMAITAPNNVMVAEVTYHYTPWFFPVTSSMLKSISSVFTQRDIKYRSAFIARELSLNDITNTTGMSDSEKALCS